MAESTERMLAMLDAAAASLRAHGASVLSHAGMQRVELRAEEVADALLGGEALPVDGTDELLSLEAEAPAPVEADNQPEDYETEEPEADLDAGSAAAVGMVVAGGLAAGLVVDFDDEDVGDAATVVDEAVGGTVGGVSWDEAQTFVSEEDSEVPLEYVLPDNEPVSYVTEDEPPVEVDEDGSDDPSDAGLVSFNEDENSYVSYEEEPVEEAAPEPVAPEPPPQVESPSYISYDEVPIGELSDADLALGTEDAYDEDEEVTLGNIQRPDPPARLPEDDAEKASYSDVGRDALVTIEEGGADVLSGLDDDEGVETFDLMPDPTEEEPVLEEDEVTLVAGLEHTAEEASKMVADDEIQFDDDRGAGARVGPPRAAPGPRVTAGLYGNPSVPTIREGNDPVPKAAAVQLTASGGGRMLGLEEEEEPIELGSVGDYGEDEDEYAGGDGLSLAIQEYDEEEEEYEDEEEEEELELDDPLPEPIPEPQGPSPEEIRAVFEKAQAAAHSGALQDAADLYSDVVDADPDHLDAHVGRGRLYLDLGDYSRAMSDFMVAEEIDESSPEPQVAIGDLYFHRKDYRKAIDYFDTALKMSPNHAMAFCRRGISHYYRKNYREALTDLEKANSLDSDIPNIASFISMAKRKAKSKR